MAKNPFQLLGHLLFGQASRRLHAHVRLMRSFQTSGRHGLARFMSRQIQRRFLVYISPTAVIPSTVRFPHPTGIVIGDGVRLGQRVRIFQNVTLGGARIGDQQAGSYPSVGDDTVIFAGAVVIGPVTIGERCIIGANSVVLRDVPAGATAVGAPARLLQPTQG